MIQFSYSPIKVTADALITECQPRNGRTYTLKEAQTAVGGYIEVVHLDDNMIMIINEEGKFGLPCNEIATAIAHQYHAIRFDDYICGDVVICQSEVLP